VLFFHLSDLSYQRERGRESNVTVPRVSVLCNS